MSRVPQSTQKVRPCRRATARLERSQCVAGRSAFTMPPHSEQWLTGASRRRWFMFSQAVPKRAPSHRRGLPLRELSAQRVRVHPDRLAQVLEAVGPAPVAARHVGHGLSVRLARLPPSLPLAFFARVPQSYITVWSTANDNRFSGSAKRAAFSRRYCTGSMT